MAKTLLHTKKLICEDLADEEDPLCVMNAMMRDIINGQNLQIQVMRSVLEALNLPQTDACEVPLNGEPYRLELDGKHDLSPQDFSPQPKFRPPTPKGKHHRRARRNV